MKSTLLCLFFVILSSFLWAQPTITSAYFVEAGDILETRIDENPHASIQPLGLGSQTWDFTALSYATEVIRDSFYTASVGVNAADFPDAELVQISNGIEYYYNVNAVNQEIIGYAGTDPVGLGLVTSAKYDEPVLFRSAPLEAFGSYNFTSAVSFAVAIDNLPDSIKMLLSSFGADSIGVEILNSVQRFGDGYGDMAIPGGNYNVLRVKTTEYRETKVKIYSSLFSDWVDVTDQIIVQFPAIEGLGKDTLKHYDFFAEGVTEAIASLYVDPKTDEVQTVIYKADPISSTGVLETPKPALTAYPNPVENDIMFQLDNVPTGNYRIKIMNILGTTVWQKEYAISTNKNIYLENLQNLIKGTYLMSLLDEKNNIISTQRLIVIRP